MTARVILSAINCLQRMRPRGLYPWIDHMKIAAFSNLAITIDAQLP